MRRGILGLDDTGTRLRLGPYTASLATSQACAGNLVEALATVDRTLQTNPDEVVHRPEILRLRGEIRLKQMQLELGEADFRESITLARSMGAKAWELRTTIRLARLLRDTDHRDEACAMLAEIYNWFTEGFDTADLKDAKALLDQLSR
jgi:predicted ATPase